MCPEEVVAYLSEGTPITYFSTYVRPWQIDEALLGIVDSLNLYWVL